MENLYNNQKINNKIFFYLDFMDKDSKIEPEKGISYLEHSTIITSDK